MPDILGAQVWRDNGALIAACNDLGYLRDDDEVYDATYGAGVFWNTFHPETLHANFGSWDIAKRHDADPRFITWGHDFRDLPFVDRYFDAVVYDPPYRLTGTPDTVMAYRYGLEGNMRWQDRMEMILDGARECARVCKRTLLVKCQDQVVSGAVRWQTHEITEELDGSFRLVDAALMLTPGNGRPQPKKRRQVHFRRNYSTLLVFERRKPPRRKSPARMFGHDPNARHVWFPR